ncbi:hypothetical protein F9L16_23340 [Agarivorans sp. B2Z047]|uniref:hypothetical protein n=1 Tax=Agarivorans sp. B2Z047 TaxID=2652721 RepID=UPI00128E01CE|nr:hypothetical protein [Agarivorans sp. B2Z047]MPW31894.1 hypothetical protein [Agarivorans sp. B2Z047]UQN40976.1 hypothetical protein LQZ07_14465 [Agarivorans sp. B2Z047]
MKKIVSTDISFPSKNLETKTVALHGNELQNCLYKIANELPLTLERPSSLIVKLNATKITKTQTKIDLALEVPVIDIAFAEANGLQIVTKLIEDDIEINGYRFVADFIRIQLESFLNLHEIRNRQKIILTLYKFFQIALGEEVLASVFGQSFNKEFIANLTSISLSTIYRNCKTGEEKGVDTILLRYLLCHENALRVCVGKLFNVEQSTLEATDDSKPKEPAGPPLGEMLDTAKLKDGEVANDE